MVTFADLATVVAINILHLLLASGAYAAPFSASRIIDRSDKGNGTDTSSAEKPDASAGTMESLLPNEPPTDLFLTDNLAKSEAATSALPSWPFFVLLVCHPCFIVLLLHSKATYFELCVQ